jgi:hypothetical protein
LAIVKSFFLKFRMLASCLFYALLLFVLSRAEHPHMPAVHPVLLGHLLQGSDRVFVPFGAVAFAPFEKYLPPSGPMSFIMDHPFSPYGTTIEQLYTAQSYLTPRILNPNGGETAGLIYCSNQDIANFRMAQNGYQMLFPVSDGKGVAVKKA